MTEPRFFPPPPHVLAEMAAAPDIHLEPGVVATQLGPEGHLGPESAGAILILGMTFVDQERSERFYEAAWELMQLLSSAPGFIRRINFTDGTSGWLIALWRTIEDAQAFAATREHRDAVKKLYTQRWQYSHFSALWEMKTNHGRIIFCDDCDGITPVGNRTCDSCGKELTDVFRLAAEPA